MDHTDYQIKAIDFGNFCLDRWLKDEKEFIKSINHSKPLRFCLNDVYRVLVQLGELPVYWKAKKEKNESVTDAISGALEWADSLEEESLVEDMSKAILVLNNLAEKRLKVTSGV